MGDPGFAGVPYVVAGFKSNQLKSSDHLEFDRISRNEQVLIEHVNRFIKDCKVLSKKAVFKHSRALHVACVITFCGWYNWKKERWGCFDREID